MIELSDAETAWVEMDEEFSMDQDPIFYFAKGWDECKKTLDAEITRLKSANKVLREELGFYGGVMNWRTRHASSNISISQRMDDVIRDDDVHFELGWATGGKRARAALAKEKQIMEGLTEAGEK